MEVDWSRAVEAVKTGNPPSALDCHAKSVRGLVRKRPGISAEEIRDVNESDRCARRVLR